MRNNRLRGVSLIEVILVIGLAIPCFYVSWQAVISARQAEARMAAAAAARSSSIFESYLRQDLACLDQSKGITACQLDTDGKALLLHLALFENDSSTISKRVTRRYELKKFSNPAKVNTYSVIRKGDDIGSSVLGGILLEDLACTWIGSKKHGYFRFDFTALDPGLQRDKQGDLYRHNSSVVASMPWLTPSLRDFDYTSNPPK